MGNVCGYNIECSDIHGKKFSTMQNFLKNQESLTLKQMFDVTVQIVHNEEEIYCLDKIVYQKNMFPRFTTLQLCDKISNLLSFLRTNTSNFHRKNSIYVNVQ